MYRLKTLLAVIVQTLLYQAILPCTHLPEGIFTALPQLINQTKAPFYKALN